MLKYKLKKKKKIQFLLFLKKTKYQVICTVFTCKTKIIIELFWKISKIALLIIEA